MQKPLLIRAALGDCVERTPLWMMRQAGRYLPEYRKIRERHTFLEMVKNPDLAAEVTLQPLRRFALDGAVVFSDILVVPGALGMEWHVDEGKGPWFERPIRSLAEIEKLKGHLGCVTEKLDYFYATLRMVAAELHKNSLHRPERPALIGFAGAPWTLAAYMIEGCAKTDLLRVKTFLRQEREAFEQLIAVLEEAVTQHLLAQAKAGADIVQIFESFAGVLPSAEFRRYSIEPVQRIIKRLHAAGVPCVYFARGVGVPASVLHATGADVLSLDWTHDLAIAKEQVANRVSLQGNLDPHALFADRTSLKNEILTVLNAYGQGHRHIFNLGHGILPETPIDSVSFLVDTLMTESPRYHVGV